MWKCDFVFLVLEIITELSAASEFITCCTTTLGAWIPELILRMFISQADVDGGVEDKQSVTETTLLLSNLQAGTIFTVGTRQSETKKSRQSIVTGGELVAASTSPPSKKTIWVQPVPGFAVALAPSVWSVSLLVPYCQNCPVPWIQVPPWPCGLLLLAHPFCSTWLHRPMLTAPGAYWEVRPPMQFLPQVPLRTQLYWAVLGHSQGLISHHPSSKDSSQHGEDCWLPWCHPSSSDSTVSSFFLAFPVFFWLITQLGLQTNLCILSLHTRRGYWGHKPC